MATAATIGKVRKAWNVTEQATVWMTAIDFAQVAHNLDNGNADWAYTPEGEKWVWSDTTALWVRVCWNGYRKHYIKNGRK